MADQRFIINVEPIPIGISEFSQIIPIKFNVDTREFLGFDAKQIETIFTFGNNNTIAEGNKNLIKANNMSAGILQSLKDIN